MLNLFWSTLDIMNKTISKKEGIKIAHIQNL